MSLIIQVILMERKEEAGGGSLIRHLEASKKRGMVNIHIYVDIVYAYTNLFLSMIFIFISILGG